MAHIHTEPGQHDSVVSAFIVLDQPEQLPKVWLHMHKKLNIWLPFGGHIELDETPWQAVEHEIKEESGYSFDQLRVLQPKLRIKKLGGVILHPQPICFHTHVFDEIHNHSNVDFGFVTDQMPKSTVGQDESNQVRAFTRQEVLDLPSEEINQNVKEIVSFLLNELLDQWESVDTREFVV